MHLLQSSRQKKKSKWKLMHQLREKVKMKQEKKLRLKKSNCRRVKDRQKTLQAKVLKLSMTRKMWLATVKGKRELIYQCSDVLLIQTVCEGASELQVTEVKPVVFYREGLVRELSSNEGDSSPMKVIPRLARRYSTSTHFWQCTVSLNLMLGFSHAELSLLW